MVRPDPKPWALPPRERQMAFTNDGYDLDGDAMEFIAAIGEWKAKTGRSYPPLPEVLRIIKALGWHKPPSAAV